MTEYPRSKLLPTVMPDQLDAVIAGLERIKSLESEIARLRLTDAEREAIREAISAFDEFAGDKIYAAALRGLLERLG